MLIGLILHYCHLTKNGIIIDEHSNRYKFSEDMWQEENELQRGIKVCFDLNSTNQIINIYKENKGGANNTNLSTPY